MGISIYNLKKWIKMICGKSILHVKQDVGKHFNKDNINGYYNDLTLKVLNQTGNKDEFYIPKFITENKEVIEFSIGVFQYALGCWDLYLSTGEEIYINKFKILSEWALENQEISGAWNTFGYKDKKFPYSSMAQGEGASVLVRAYKEFHDKKYLFGAKKAIDFMLISVEMGGTSLYVNNEIYLQEFVSQPTVLNGWIFSIFGLYDLMLITSEQKYKLLFDLSCTTLINNTHKFVRKYWTNYNIDGTIIASPFYHKLHIAQFKTLHLLTGNEHFRMYYKKFEKQDRSIIGKSKAFLIKAKQKIFK